jgi:hypothetical protein
VLLSVLLVVELSYLLSEREALLPCESEPLFIELLSELPPVLFLSR